MSFFAKLFGFGEPQPLPRPSIPCPYCISEVTVFTDAVTCPNCRLPLPPRYLKKYHDAPALFLPMMGPPNAGKSNFLTALTVAVVSGHQFWNELDSYALTDDTDSFLTEVKQRVGEGDLPARTVKSAEKIAYTLQVLHLPRWQDRTWILRDVAGEDFIKRKIDDAQVPFLIHSSTAFLFFDFNGKDPGAGNQADCGRGIDQVFKAFVMGLEEKGISFDRQHNRKVVIVLTKADRLDLPAPLARYLQEDEHWDEGQRRILTNGYSYFTRESMVRYMDNLRSVSTQLREWIKTKPGGKGLLNAADITHKIELHFCMISAIPCGVEEGEDGKFKPKGKWQEPLRVLDPLYWALELNSEPTT